MRYQIAYQIYNGINIFLNIASWALFIYCLMTWFVRPNSPIYIFAARFVEPIVAPFRPLSRRLMEKGVMLDTSVILAILGIRVVSWLVGRLFMWFIF